MVPQRLLCSRSVGISLPLVAGPVLVVGILLSLVASCCRAAETAPGRGTMSVYDNALRALPYPLRAKGRSPLQPSGLLPRVSPQLPIARRHP